MFLATFSKDSRLFPLLSFIYYWNKLLCSYLSTINNDKDLATYSICWFWVPWEKESQLQFLIRWIYLVGDLGWVTCALLIFQWLATINKFTLKIRKIDRKFIEPANQVVLILTHIIQYEVWNGSYTWKCKAKLCIWSLNILTLYKWNPWCNYSWH
jgi:hypothetical protein